MEETFQWMNYLTLYLPLWTTRLPTNKYRSLIVNILGISITIISITAFILIGEYNFCQQFMNETESIDKFDDMINATMLILQTTARIDQFYIFLKNFNYPWKNRFINKYSNINEIQTKNISNSNLRIKIIFVLFIIFSFTSKLWYLNDINFAMTITIWLILPSIIMSTIICSIIFLKYELYLDNILHILSIDKHCTILQILFSCKLYGFKRWLEFMEYPLNDKPCGLNTFSSFI
eukprot:190051_1